MIRRLEEKATQDAKIATLRIAYTRMQGELGA
jgi:hypothetical protein